MPKILHTADVHLDSPLKSLAFRDPDLRTRIEAATRGALARIVDTALDEGVAALMIAGDLHDGTARSARTAAFLTAQFDRLAAAGIEVFVIRGNHDAENPLTGEVRLPANVHVFDGRGGKKQVVGHDIWIHGVSFSKPHAPESLVPKFGAPVPGAVNLAMLHTSLAGAPGHDAYAPCSLADLTGAGFDYWALGHIHKRQVHAQSPWVVMPGTPQGRDIGEPGPMSATLLTIEDGRIDISEVPTAEVEFLRREIDASTCETEDDLRATLRLALRRIADGCAAGSAVVRLRLTGAFPRHWQVERDRDVWHGFAEEAARETGSLWIDKLELALTAPADAPSGGAANELAHLMAEIADEPVQQERLEAQVAEVMNALPAGLRDRLAGDAEAAAALAREMADAGARHVTALMKGTGE